MTQSFVFKLWENDPFIVEGASVINLNDPKQHIYTFWHPKGGKRHLYATPRPFRDEALDLLYLSMMVYYADRKVRRSTQADAWTRHFALYLPVLAIDKWNHIKDLLTKALEFLTGDKWSLYFRHRVARTNQEVNYSQSRYHFRHSIHWLDTNVISLLSGGLDSFIGAIDLLSCQELPLFISNYNGGKGVSIYQNQVINSLSSHYHIGNERFFQFYASPKSGLEDSTRSRSLLFFAHAITIASGMEHPVDLNIPENGVISLNIPLTIHRLGSLSTRTTHPFFISLLQQILDQLGLEITLKNPFQFSTKGEMMQNCRDKSYLDANYELTMSCSHPDQNRWAHDSHPSHCGVCLPCTIRRAAIMKAGLVDSSYYRDIGYHNPEARFYLKSYRQGLAEVKYPLSDIQLSGPITERQPEYASLYQRGLQELKDFIDTLL